MLCVIAGDANSERSDFFGRYQTRLFSFKNNCVLFPSEQRISERQFVRINVLHVPAALGEILSRNCDDYFSEFDDFFSPKENEKPTSEVPGFR